MKNFVIFIITLYQKIISPLLGRHCRFYPSCSEYAKIAFSKYGLFIGFFRTFLRLLKCHPFHSGGVDYP
ncbi:MAG: membrane protein insertion efficiency factor YidD [Endomicrobia bacterium]|nr:membrane protein insertion efficiency factor YidD [Endomicrobiia bacterium]MCX7940700.1 membrane protein insertion efficiency factor YidD [Endomicrobiia bacterium]MDW8055741.1 membrane protein insertion efficiency factor YidD [Elusimicrobiota bacterium]